MRVETVSVTYGRRFNLDNFESVEASVTIWAKLEDDDPDVSTCLSDAFAVAKEQVRAEVTPALVQRDARRRSKMQDIMRGLPRDLREIAEGVLQTEFSDMPPLDSGNGRTS